jgi:lipopolysaccharide transport system ATP-binding protein
MSEAVIRVEGLGKRYAIGERERYLALRDVLARAFNAPLRLWRRPPREHIWALKDVSFEVAPGEVVGIIGRNGAGKTTLLKLLSRITRPTEGFAEIRGRIGSLLEVGTGFHPELTGRENVFLSGAILGMSKEEIRRKFDEIVAFAEVERFIDTPLKHYSSGMEMRLAFAVAAHLEPEILLVDEVLAVGDAAFQKKCLGKMGEVAQAGRTILFVSHNMTAHRSLCSRAFILSEGQVVFSGSSDECVDRYLLSVSDDMRAETITADLPRPIEVAKDATLRITRVEFRTPTGAAVLHSGKPIFLKMDFEVYQRITNMLMAFSVHSSDGLRVFECRSLDTYGPINEMQPGRYSIECALENNPLNPGLYCLTVGSRCESKGLDWLPNVMTFRVELPERIESLWLESPSGLVHQASRWSVPTAWEHTDTSRACVGR